MGVAFDVAIRLPWFERRSSNMAVVSPLLMHSCWGMAMYSVLARSIREARRASGLTQNELGRRLGLKGRAVYRWERDEAAPTKRHRRALFTAVQAVNQGAAAKLALALAGQTAAPAQPAAPPPTAAVIPGPVALELAILALADDLDATPRRARGSLVRFCKRLRAANLSVEAVQAQLEAWVANAS